MINWQQTGFKLEPFALAAFIGWFFHNTEPDIQMDTCPHLRFYLVCLGVLSLCSIKHQGWGKNNNNNKRTCNQCAAGICHQRAKLAKQNTNMPSAADSCLLAAVEQDLHWHFHPSTPPTSWRPAVYWSRVMSHKWVDAPTQSTAKLINARTI